jgi:hypothetical protein
LTEEGEEDDHVYHEEPLLAEAEEAEEAEDPAILVHFGLGKGVLVHAQETVYKTE